MPNRSPQGLTKRRGRRRAAKAIGRTQAGKPIPRKWLRIIRQIPGRYDPVATAAPGDYFDTEAAQLALDFFPECLRHTKGKWAGDPFVLEGWETAIVANLFGWKRADGLRRYRYLFLMVGRKNGKSALAAGIILYVMFCDGEPGAELYSAAADREQAKLIWDQAEGMIRQSPELQARCTVYRRSIVLGDLSAKYLPLSADAYTKHGYNAHVVVVDELHAQRNSELVDVLRTSMGARTQPMMIYVTTSDYDRPSVCNDELEYAEAVRDGREGFADPEYLPVIYAAPIECQGDGSWIEPEVWRLANPNMDVSIFGSFLTSECRKAQLQPTKRNTFLRLHLNIRTQQDIRWIPIEEWDLCDGDLSWEEMRDDLEGNRCWGGLDASATQDLTAFVLYFPEWHSVLAWFWAPQLSAEDRSRAGEAPYIEWAEMGALRLTPGRVVDYDLVEEDVLGICERYDVVDIGLDRWNTTQLMTHLIEEGLEIVPFGQGYQSMSYPCKELEKLIISHALEHGGHPVLRWNAQNVSIKEKGDEADNIKPNKATSAGRIDGIVANVMALGRSMAEDIEKESVYEERGLVIIGAEE